jgi:predicted outer membrane repeat protein
MSKVTNRTTCLIMSVLLLARLCTNAAGKTIYVDDDAAGANDGSSWQNAYVYLQDAMVDANSAEKPVEIRVAQGIYKPDQGAFQITGDREATFRLINGVAFKGGYAGLGEPDPDARNVELYETILSGDLNSDDIKIDNVEIDYPWDLLNEPTRAENSYNVVISIGTDDSAVLDGFTITNGNANHRSLFGPPAITGTVDDRLTSGAGMFNIFVGPIVINCTFTMNSAFSGGGMFNYDCSLILNNSNFSKNYSMSGGGMYNGNCSLTLTNCTFSENQAGDGGGICNVSSSILNLTDCTFIGNSAEFNGGGMYGGTATLTNCAFIANDAVQGGGLITNPSSILTDCTFIANKAIYWGGGISSWSNDTVSHCTFSGNSAGICGGAIYTFDTDINLTNCTLTGNSALNGSALACVEVDKAPSNIELTNCILWDIGNEIWNDDGSTIVISYSNIKGGQTGIHDPYGGVIWGQGNIDADPLFADPGYWVNVNDPNIIVEPNDPNNELWVDGDYHLKSEAGRWDPVGENWVIDDVTSPCIDAGDPLTPVMYEPHPRGYFINMGAYGGTKEASKSHINGY